MFNDINKMKNKQIKIIKNINLNNKRSERMK